MNKSPNVVYALHRPGLEWRYIGVTCNEKNRVATHKHQARTRKYSVSRWITKHPDFQMTVVARFFTYEEAQDAEVLLIAAFREAGYDLLNIAPGGGGATGVVNQHANKTHCKRGHEFTKDNTIYTSQGSRSCKTCQKAYFAELDKERNADPVRKAIRKKQSAQRYHKKAHVQAGKPSFRCSFCLNDLSNGG